MGTGKAGAPGAQKGAAGVLSRGSLVQQCCPRWEELGIAAPQQRVQARSPVGSWSLSSPAAAGR